MPELGQLQSKTNLLFRPTVDLINPADTASYSATGYAC